ncbi:SnoaL-like polyketide cyclase-domain-containing protein [Xylaria castorea]|nr:SnoaL-like polyketide cyclase-domain-containing protein [Xylaria castorea]
MPYMAANESLYRSYVQCINQNRWKDLPDVLTFPLNFNGDVILTPEAFEAAGTAYGRIKLSSDAFTVDNDAGRLAATSVVELRPKNCPEKVVRFMKQTIVWIKNGRVSRMITTGTPEQEVERQLFWPGYDFTPDLISAYSNGHYKAGRQHVSGQVLESTYRDYIGSINGRTMQSKLPSYCQCHVIHNNKRLSIDEYRLLIQEAIIAIPDIKFDVDTIVVDHTTQRVAVRLKFTGTPTGKLSGVEPTGRSVRFYEFAVYFFEEGKIDRVWSIVDWDSYRKQLTRT